MQTRCSITVDQVSIKSDRLVGHRCAKPSGSLIPLTAWLDACDAKGGGGSTENRHQSLPKIKSTGSITVLRRGTVTAELVLPIESGSPSSYPAQKAASSVSSEQSTNTRQSRIIRRSAEPYRRREIHGSTEDRESDPGSRSGDHATRVSEDTRNGKQTDECSLMRIPEGRWMR